MFKIGDLITGVDRSYQRSIYRYAGLVTTPEGKGLRYEEDKEQYPDIPMIGALGAHLQFVAHKRAGFIKDKEFWDIYRLADKVVELYRLATEEEIGEAYGLDKGRVEDRDQSTDTGETGKSDGSR